MYEERDALALGGEEKRLLWLYYTGFVRNGAKLGPDAKKRLADINQALAKLYTAFGQNLLAEESTQMVLLDGEGDLAGLPDPLRVAAAQAAEGRGRKGKWAVVNTRSSVDPFLTYSTRRDLREKVWRMFTSRGDNRDAHDNADNIAHILKLRAERAKLLGYETFAHWQLEQTMARTPERAMALLEAVWTPAVARVHEEVRDMQAIADKEGAHLEIAPWDYHFYAEKVRKAKYDLDENELKPYLQLEKLREGMFFVAGELLGLRFLPITDGSVPVYHPDVRVWRVEDARGKHVGLWFFDPYARPGKRSGAWMNAYRAQSRVDREVRTIVSNNANFIKGAPDEPILVSLDDARTLFHEFGHALHGLSSNVTYPSVSGTSVARDFVEFPSQVLERWLLTPEVLDHYALHVKTGAPMPAALVERISKSQTFNQGFLTVEYLASALIDMKLHLAGDKPVDPRAFEKRDARRAGDAVGARDAAPDASVPARLRGRRLRGGLLQLPVGRHALGGRVGGLQRGQGAIRQGRRAPVPRDRALRRQLRRSRRGVPGVPRSGRGHPRAPPRAWVPPSVERVGGLGAERGKLRRSHDDRTRACSSVPSYSSSPERTDPRSTTHCRSRSKPSGAHTRASWTLCMPRESSSSSGRCSTRTRPSWCSGRRTRRTSTRASRSTRGRRRVTW